MPASAIEKPSPFAPADMQLPTDDAAHLLARLQPADDVALESASSASATEQPSSPAPLDITQQDPDEFSTATDEFSAQKVTPAMHVLSADEISSHIEDRWSPGTRWDIEDSYDAQDYMAAAANVEKLPRTPPPM